MSPALLSDRRVGEGASLGFQRRASPGFGNARLADVCNVGQVVEVAKFAGW